MSLAETPARIVHRTGQHARFVFRAANSKVEWNV
jgi:hypothetical protein